MKKALTLCALLLMTVSARSQPGVTPTPVTLSPAAAPVPALRYSLLPPLRERQSGNAALLYYRCFSPDWGTIWREKVRQPLGEWARDTQKMPPEITSFLLKSTQMKELDLAARRTYCDWERLPRLREEGIMMLLPDVQGMREMGTANAARARFQLAKNDYRAAIQTIQTGFQMARDVANAPTLIEYLVGMAIAKLTIEQVEVWISQPDSPNLYWSLASLPRPFKSLDMALEGERIWMDSIFPDARAALYKGKIKPWSHKKVKKWTAVFTDLDNAIFQPERMPSWSRIAAGSLMVAAIYPEAKKALAPLGLNEEKLKDLPMVQVVMLAEVLHFDRYMDSVSKWIRLPFSEAAPHLEKTNREFRKESLQGSRGMQLARMLSPATEKVLLTQARMDRSIAALQCLEALRLHAKANNGDFPDKLSDIQVPIPKDPVTGRDFEYTKTGSKAKLSAGPPKGWGITRYNTLEYDITLK